MSNEATVRRDMSRRHRAIDAPKCIAWPTEVGSTALPMILSESTYAELATLKCGEATRMGTSSNYLFAYRALPDEKMVGLEFCSAVGANDNTQVWELGLYAAPAYTSRTTPTQTGWKRLGTANFTMTLGTTTLASQTKDPYDNTQTISSATLRWADTYAETDNDFNNTTAGFYRMFPMGFGAVNKSGLVILDLSMASLIVMRLTTKPAQPSTSDFVGLFSEIN